jgi:hypothetical protein
MRLTLDSGLNYTSGDILFDICGRKVKIKDYSIRYNNGKPIQITFVCYYDSGDTGSYSYSQLYDSFDDLDDAEKSFLKWIKKNPDVVYFDIEEIDSLRQCYIDAFYHGFNHRIQYSAEEQLQK